MTERPILFSAPMVRAILAGTKTQTRRVVKPQPIYDGRFAEGWKVCGKNGHEAATCSPLIAELCPYGQPGDRLWVREAWLDLQGTGIERVTGDPSRYAYAADTPSGSHGDECRKNYGLQWRPSIHMPRAASRITLEITSVRVERLQDISEDDAKAQGAWGPDDSIVNQVAAHFGCEPTGVHPSLAYRMLWEQINGAGSWEANPWVWVAEFKRADGSAT